MNYQKATIKKYSINKNLLLLGLVLFACFVQSCTPAKKGVRPMEVQLNKETLLKELGKIGQTNSKLLKDTIVDEAKLRNEKVTLKFSNGEIASYKLPTVMHLLDEQGKKTPVDFFAGLGSKSAKAPSILARRGEAVQDAGVDGLFKEILDEFKKSNDKDKNPKFFIVVRFLELQEAVKAATNKREINEAVEKFKGETAKVLQSGLGVVAKMDRNVQATSIEFVDLVEGDSSISKAKYILTEGLDIFMKGIIDKIGENFKKC